MCGNWGPYQGVFLFVALNPVIPLSLTHIVKDVWGGVSFLAFVAFVGLLILSILGKRQYARTDWAGMAASALFVGLTRNDGFIVVLATMLLILLWVLLVKSPSWKPLVGSVVVLICVAVVVSGPLSSLLGVTPSHVRETLSIPMQQVALCIKEHPEDITTEEYQILENSFDCSLEELAACYSSSTSDPVKDHFIVSEREDLLKFLCVWAGLGSRHMGSYLAAIVSNTLGYWWPFEKAQGPESAVTVDFASILNDDVFDRYEEDVRVSFVDRYGTWGTPLFPMAASLLANIANILRCMPVIGLLFVPGIYVWALLICVGYLIYKHCPLVLVTVPMILKVAVCCVSPLSISMRYAFPITYSSFLLVILCAVASSMGTSPAEPSEHPC